MPQPLMDNVPQMGKELGTSLPQAWSKYGDIVSRVTFQLHKKYTTQSLIGITFYPSKFAL